ncbi:WXG100 family type VII secretion target [Streptomyces sp. SL13]|jgi:WXG100 family type VII secretion target|uniref:WXG100 family type VII secretion target n=1 Tax=Streptantibioticus silvisoli TaxID=2705255 RepID=A0AA90K098_9ACTN|nr:WXG100 family type VII secretion target [Streptantibioticus silvisoli]MDI5963751.1 WXG100 family type VII secretion target [Streptantibioticus silvisoli]MDI5972866.1 WXG100 family type VII secretion target [Streptantibioticus silvisoli]
MTTYTVQMEQVDYIVGEMNSITQRINQTLQELDNQSKVNLSEWTSDAQQTYAQVKAQWDSAAADMTQKATSATQMLGNINEYYSNGERQGVSLWG